MVFHAVERPARGLGQFFAMCLDTLVEIFRPPFAWREFLTQAWFVTRVTLLPAMMLAIPFEVLITFAFNILLLEIGAADLSGVGAGSAVITQSAAFVTVMVISGASATAMCADLGSRKIREEIDALRVMGINPIHVLVVPRVMAITFITPMLCALVIIAGLLGAFFFSVYFQHVTPGAFAAGITLLAGTREVVICFAKSTIFGLTAGLIACYKGINASGGPQGVGNGVAETVVYTIIALFVLDLIATILAVKIGVTT